jgi:hypothetical protein
MWNPFEEYGFRERELVYLKGTNLGMDENSVHEDTNQLVLPQNLPHLRPRCPVAGGATLAGDPFAEYFHLHGVLNRVVHNVNGHCRESFRNLTRLGQLNLRAPGSAVPGVW